MHVDLFPNNTRSNFETYMQEDVLSYIPNGSIEVAVKSITFDNSRVHEGLEQELKEESLALRTNLIPSVISSFGYANVAAIFTVRRSGLTIFEFQNPTFFESSKELLSRANFRIENFSTGKVPDFRIGPPTLVEIAVRLQVPRLKEPFQMLLDSSCPHSKKNFPLNTNSDFIIQLPHHLDFQKDWNVCLKSIHLSNEIETIHNCWGKVGNHLFKLEDGYVANLSVVIDKLNAECAGKVIFELASDERMVTIKDDSMYWEENKTLFLFLQLSNNLCHLLGFPMGEDGVNLNTFVFKKPHPYTLYQSFIKAGISNLESRLNEINKTRDSWAKVGDSKIKLMDGYDGNVTSLKEVIDKLNKKFAGKIIFELTSKKMVTMKDDPNYWKEENNNPNPPLLLQMSINLCYYLGFEVDAQAVESGVMAFMFVEPFENTIHKSSFNANIFSLQPRQFIVCADFVEHSALGGQQVQMLKYFVVPQMEQKNKRIDVDFNINAYVKLNNKNFDRIHIRILSAADGQLVKSNPNSPTLLQLLFVNTNSPISK